MKIARCPGDHDMLQPDNRQTFLRALFKRQNRVLLLAGFAAVLACAYLFLKNWQGGRYLDMLPFSQEKDTGRVIRLTQAGYWVSPTAVTAQQNSDNVFSVNPQERQWLVDWISARYPVDEESTELFVSAAYLAAHEIGLDPHLILAVMAIESSFNPEAVSPVGAQGLMQVMPQVHAKRFEPHGGITAARDPVTNIRVGSAILKEYVSRRGSVERGLKSYVGAAAHSHDFGYGARVLAEYRRLKDVSLGKKVPTVFATRVSTESAAVSGKKASRATVTLPVGSATPEV